MDEHEKQALRDLKVDVKELSTKVSALENKDILLESAINNLVTAIDKLVSIERFTPVQYIAYGLAGGVLMSALGGVMALVFIK